MLKIALALAVVVSGGDAPSDAEVLRAMPRIPRGVPHVYEEWRDNIVIVKSRFKRDIVAVPVFRCASVRLLKEQWECVVYYDQVIESDFLFPIRVKKSWAMVVYRDVISPLRIEKGGVRY